VSSSYSMFMWVAGLSRGHAFRLRSYSASPDTTQSGPHELPLHERQQQLLGRNPCEAAAALVQEVIGPLRERATTRASRDLHSGADRTPHVGHARQRSTHAPSLGQKNRRTVPLMNSDRHGRAFGACGSTLPQIAQVAAITDDVVLLTGIRVLPSLHHLPRALAVPETGLRLDPLAVGQIDAEHVRLARGRDDGAGRGRRSRAAGRPEG
jgi:hypothetical protein